MKLRPTIFLSGVSSEFASFRDAVEIEVQKKGCFAENQSSFGVDYHTVEEMLRRRISDSDAVIHIVGFRFGAEPGDHKPRRSYTQIEYDIARELEKPIYVFLSADASVCDAPGADEEPEATALQLAHRQTIKSTNNLRYTFKDKDELRHLAAEIDVVAQADFRVDISRIDRYAPAELIGREDELALLNDAWLKVRRAEPKRPHILTFVALGGEGKTSLVAKWLADLAYQNWPGCDSAFAWSFYSQGTREQYASSSDLFLKEAITFFGDAADKEFAASAAGAYEKGQRLARIVSQSRALLILDGLEPLQYAPTSPTAGELKDAGITALLKGLAAHSDGLCIVTTRYSLPNLKAFWRTTATEFPLTRLSQAAGIHLLKTLGVKGSAKEFESVVADVKGHALTLNLLGTYLRDAHGGDIRRRDLVKLGEADSEEQSGHAFRVMAAYEEAFKAEGEQGERALAILRLLGLFDRPVTVPFIGALLERPAIASLTTSLIGLHEAQRNLIFRRLEQAKLLTINREATGALISLDGHPLLREYFAQRLYKQHPKAWRAGHRRLYEHLCASTPDKNEPTLEDLQPLYQAITHGCQAGLQQDVCDTVYYERILRQKQHYTWHTLGAYGSELGAQACFFEVPWTRLTPNIGETAQSWLLNEAAFCLRALGRLIEALEPMQLGLRMSVEQENWRGASIQAGNLSEIFLTLGELGQAIQIAEQSVTYGDKSGDGFQQLTKRAKLGTALTQSGRRAEAKKYFQKAEELQRSRDSRHPLLYSLHGAEYCDLLLVETEREVWQAILERNNIVQSKTTQAHNTTTFSERLVQIHQRAATILEWEKQMVGAPLLDFAVHHLTLARTTLHEMVLHGTDSAMSNRLKGRLEDAMNSFRRAGAQDYIPRGLLIRAWLRFLLENLIGPESAQEDLDEAWEIAERGPMRLHMADIHLYRARLFFREKEYPWESPEADLKAARKVIEQCGYWRRREELEDAERVILNNPR